MIWTGTLRAPGAMSGDCTSCRVDLRDSAIYGYVLGGAETLVTDIASCIARVGGDFADAQNISGGHRTGGLHVV